MPLKPKYSRETPEELNDNGSDPELAYFFPSDTEDWRTELYPWLRDNYNSNNESHLCLKCSRLNFLYLTGQPTQYDIYLGTVDEGRKRDCSFCSLIFSNIRADGRISKNEIVEDGDRVFLSSSQSLTRDFQWSHPSRSKADDIFALKVRVSRVLGLEWSLSDVLPLRMDSTINEDSIIFPRILSPKYDPAFLRDWLDDCARHESFIPEPQAIEFIDRFIDCVDYRLVNVKERFLEGHTEPIEFAALSYVWGQADQQTTLTRKTSDALFQAGVLSPENQTISRTIKDAITVCRGLAIRYLWVDALCIYQDDKELEKSKQISNLHRIYENTVVTIVAAEGDHADRGLSGISHVPKHGRQPSVTVQGRRMIMKPPGLEVLFDKLMWATRAWTFQEFLLSRKALIFTDIGVYFICPHGLRSEAVSNPTHSSGFCYDFQRMSANGLIYEKKNALNWGVYAKLASSYTKKNLTKATDRNPAFLALSEAMSRDLFLGTPFIYGLPVADLDAALLWRRCLGCIECTNTSSGLTRIPGAGPSWSWAGWVGHVQYSSYVMCNPNPAKSTVRIARFKEALEVAPGVFMYSTPAFPAVSGLPFPEQAMRCLAGGSSRTASDDASDTTGTTANEPNAVRPANNIPPDVAGWRLHGEGYKAPRGDWAAIYTHPFNERQLCDRRWLIQDRGLLVETEAASFAVVNRYFDGLEMQEFHPHIYTGKALLFGQSVGNPLAIYDLKTGYYCGVLFDDFDYELPRPQGLNIKLPIRTTFIKLSVSTLSQEERPSYKAISVDDFLEISDLMKTLRHEQATRGPDLVRCHFDYDKYDCNRLWCMYNVLMVAFFDEGKRAHRLGVGKIHVDAFDHALGLERRTFTLV